MLVRLAFSVCIGACVALLALSVAGLPRIRQDSSGFDDALRAAAALRQPANPPQ